METKAVCTSSRMTILGIGAKQKVLETKNLVALIIILNKGVNMNNLLYDRIFTRPCAVCGSLTKVDMYRQGECPNCGWYNDLMGEDNEDKVVYPNLVSLNKARELYKQGKPFEPNIYEFFEAYHFYGEMQFVYKGIRYGIISACREDNEDAIDFFEINCMESQVFESDEDFIQNAKIGEEYVKDIWDKTTERYWLQ